MLPQSNPPQFCSLLVTLSLDAPHDLVKHISQQNHEQQGQTRSVSIHASKVSALSYFDSNHVASINCLTILVQWFQPETIQICLFKPYTNLSAVALLLRLYSSMILLEILLNGRQTHGSFQWYVTIKIAHVSCHEIFSFFQNDAVEKNFY